MTLRDAKRGQRVRLSTGRVVTVGEKCGDDRWAREYLGEYEWNVGRFGPREGELECVSGKEEVSVVE